MKTFPRVLIVCMFAIAAAMALPLNALAQGAEQTDHMLLPGTEVGYCGLARNAEPLTLHITASGGQPTPSVGTLKIEFRDGDSIALNIPPNSSIGFTQAMGGVPGVDDLVRISLSWPSTQTTIPRAWVSAMARPNATDPFIEPGVPEDDNLCVNLTDEGPINTLLEVPDSWVEDGFGANGGQLK